MVTTATIATPDPHVHNHHAALRGAARTLAEVQDRNREQGGRHVGDLITWNAEKIDAARAVVRGIFESANAGLEKFVADIEPGTALHRASHEVRAPKGFVIRPFAKTDAPAAIGIYAQRAKETESGDDFVLGARCRVDLATGTILALPPEGGAPSIDVAMETAEQIAALANHLITSANTRDVSLAMVATVRHLAGVPLRERGGFYLLPPSQCATWRMLEAGLESLGVKPIRIEMIDSPANVKVAAVAAKSALEADIAELIADLDKAASPDGMRKDAVARRVQICGELTAKAELFRGVLEGTADKIAQRLEALRIEFVRQLSTDTTPGLPPGPDTLRTGDDPFEIKATEE